MAYKLVGQEAYQIPSNADLGTLAYQNSDALAVGLFNVANTATISGLVAPLIVAQNQSAAGTYVLLTQVPTTLAVGQSIQGTNIAAGTMIAGFTAGFQASQPTYTGTTATTIVAMTSTYGISASMGVFGTGITYGTSVSSISNTGVPVTYAANSATTAANIIWVGTTTNLAVNQVVLGSGVSTTGTRILSIGTNQYVTVNNPVTITSGQGVTFVPSVTLSTAIAANTVTQNLLFYPVISLSQATSSALTQNTVVNAYMTATNAGAAALTIQNGGIAVTGNSYFASPVSITNTNNGGYNGATNSALYVAGGIGAANQIWTSAQLGSTVFAGVQVALNNSGSAFGNIGTLPYITGSGYQQWVLGWGASSGSIATATNVALIWSNSGTVILPNASTWTVSTGTATGALTVAGGVGIGGALNVGNTATILATTNATSTLTGALQVRGGAGIGSDVWIGGTLNVLGSINATVNGTVTTATNIANGTAGQIPYQSSPGVTAFAGPGTAGQILTSNGTSAPTYQNTLTLAGTTAATSTNTGALQVAGGVGIGGDLYIGGTAYSKGWAVNTSTASTINDAWTTVAGKVFGYTTSTAGTTALGYQAGSTSTTGANNIAIGQFSLCQTTTGYGNVSLGYTSMCANTVGHDNVAVGMRALRGNTCGSNNVALGSSALMNNTSGCYNIAVGGAMRSSIGASHSNIGIGYGALTATNGGCDNVALGFYGLCSNTSGSNNFAVGRCALFSNSIGVHNVAIGCNALLTNTTGNNNIGIGCGALYLNTSGTNNFAAGCCSLYCNTTGCNNTALGASALKTNSVGTDNVAVGFRSLELNISGNYNVAIGCCALLNNTTGSNNFAAGTLAMACNVSGANNIAIGSTALRCNIGGNNNTGLGSGTLSKNATGCNNLAVGWNALACNYGGHNNTAVGCCSMYYNFAGSNNVAFGYATLYCNTTGTNNTAIGCRALYGNTIGTDNTAIGHCALRSNTTGSHNFAAGCTALQANTCGCQNVAIGYRSMYGNTTGANNVALGVNSLRNVSVGNNNIALGQNTLYGAGAAVTGSCNIAFGVSAMYCTSSGFGNIGLGYNALFANTSGKLNIALGNQTMACNTVGSDNIAFGNNSLLANTSGTANIAIGCIAMSSNTIGNDNIGIGRCALKCNTTGNQNIGLGYSAGCAITTGSYNVVIGSNTGSTFTNTNGNVVLSDGIGTIKIGFTATGAMYFGNTLTNVGTAGQILMSQGPTGEPIWGSVSAVGTATYINIVDDSSTATPQYLAFTSVSTGTGQIKVDSAELTFVPSTGLLKSPTLQITSTASSTASYSANALYVAGGIGGNSGFNINGSGYLNGNLYVNGFITGTNVTLNTLIATSGTFYGDATGSGALYAGVTGFTPFAQTMFQSAGNFNNYMEINVQNINSGAKASTDIVASADNVTESSAYIDMGIASSTFDGSQLYSLGQTLGPNDGYVMVGQNATPGRGDLVFGTTTVGTQMRFVVAANATTVTMASVVLTVNTATTVSTSTATGALIVNGGVGIGGSVYSGGSLYASTNLLLSTTFASNAGLQLTEQGDITRPNGSIRLVAGGGVGELGTTMPGAYFQNNAKAIIYGGATGGIDLTAGNSGNVTVTKTTASTSTGTGALVVQGGVGIWGNLYVGGTINGTVGLATTGTNIAGGTAGQVPYQTAPGATSFFGPGTAGNVLVSNGTGAPTYNNTLILSGTTVATNTTSGALRVVGGVGIGGSVYIAGSLYATTKSFYIDHPTKPGMKLKYGSLEGPENGVYVRGRCQGQVIELPDYWTGLVDPDSITVDLTPVGSYQQLYIEKIEDNKIYVRNDKMFTSKIDCFYTVWAERKDVDKLVVEA